MKEVLIFILIASMTICNISFIHSQDKRKSLAVLEFKSTGGLGVNEVTTLTNRFRGILVNTDRFDVVEREKMNDILKQQNMNISDNCNSAECAVQVGQLLGVEEMIAGDIGSVGQTWTIDLRLIDVETGKIIKTRSEDYKGEIDGLLSIMRSIAGSFAGTTIEQKTVIERATNEYGDFYIVSTPSHGEIYLDGRKTDWMTPFLIENIPVGMHTIEVRSGNYIGSKEIELTKGALKNVNLILSLPTVPVKVVSDPLEASIYIDGKEMGKTPVILDIEVGDHTITMSKPGYIDFSMTFTIKSGKPSTSIVGELSKISILKINVFVPVQSDGGEVLIYIDEQNAGTPPVAKEVSTGKHIIRITTSGSDLDEFVQAVNLDGETTVNAQLAYKESFLATHADLKKKADNGSIDYTPYVSKTKR